ncbi:hypothetical protein TELCIR_03759 [Teladorsagia circumcincta]|uniref:Uncharacterized protein n=1 Tax=Teladorsagia circumcincta TaxID=45464 RepID=A0A2G9UVN3_TELCI|nr:hypothetical protein TELCIR_03759 [Teladorsagia circumcincta]
MGQASPGLEKLMASLRKLKIDEEASFTSVKKGLEEATVDINNNIQARDHLLRSIAGAEAQCEESRKCLETEREYVQLQTLKIAEGEEELDILRKKKDEAITTLNEVKCSLETLRASDAASAKKLLALINETKSMSERFSQLRDDRSAFEEQKRAEELKWQRDLANKKEELNVKRADLERRIKNQEEELQLTTSRLEVLRGRLGELNDDRARLTSEMTKYMVAAEELKKELADQRQEKNYEEVVLALERDLLAFTDRIALEKKIMQERRLKVLSNLSNVGGPRLYPYA